MKLTEQQHSILKARTCPYCKQGTKCVDSANIYGKSYGYIHWCEPCDAYVGCHKGTKTPLGRLANKELRELKKEAHLYFDKIWSLKILGWDRSEAYKWLSERLKLPAKYTHIGMFSETTCKEVIWMSKLLLNDNRDLDRHMGAKPVTPHYEIN